MSGYENGLDNVRGSRIVTYLDGTVYTGEFSHGAKWGNGCYVTAQGEKLEGEWEDDVLLPPDDESQEAKSSQEVEEEGCG